jgi:NAD(P)-dependent dehydrogenase (short-subunit alcohol dehydrogenase family)
VARTQVRVASSGPKLQVLPEEDMTTANTARDTLAVVTGASSGIGYERAKVFARARLRILILVSDSERSPGAAGAHAGRQRGGGCLSKAEPLDPRWGESLVPLIRDSDGPSRFGGEFNAAIGVWGDFARETSLDDELRLVNLNVTGSCIWRSG